MYQINNKQHYDSSCIFTSSCNLINVSCNLTCDRLQVLKSNTLSNKQFTNILFSALNLSAVNKTQISFFD